jgi:hypothetical protein
MPISIKPTKRGRESNKTGGRTTTKPEDEGLRVPPEPTYSSDKDPALYDEQQVTRCEMMMAQGVRDPSELQKRLNLRDLAKVRAYIERVEARWKIGGGEKNIAGCRGEQLFLLRALEAEIWRKIEGSNRSTAFDARGRRVENAISTRELLRLTGRILAISARRAEVQGLTKEVIKNLPDNPPLNFRRSPEVFAAGQQVAAHILDICEEKIKEEKAMRAAASPTGNECDEDPDECEGG